MVWYQFSLINSVISSIQIFAFGNLIIKHYVFNLILQEEFKGYTFPVAVAIVLSDQYEDDQDNSADIVYTGQGGKHFVGRKHQIKDQEMKLVIWLLRSGYPFI